MAILTKVHSVVQCSDGLEKQDGDLSDLMKVHSVAQCSTGLKKQDSDLAEVEVDEMFRLVRYVAPKVPSHNAMPGRVVLFVKLFLDEGSDVLFYVVLLECLRGAVHRVLLHLLRHVSILHYRFPIPHRHSATYKEKIITNLRCIVGKYDIFHMP